MVDLGSIATRGSGFIQGATRVLSGLLRWVGSLSLFEKALFGAMIGLGVWTYMKYIELSKSNYQRREPREI